MKASVIGGGSWGSAFSIHLGRINTETKLWVREENLFHRIVQTRQNTIFLPGIEFPPKVTPYRDMEEAVSESDILFIAVPSKFCRHIYQQLSPFLRPTHIIVSLTKGIEEDSLKRMSEIMEDVFPSPHKKHIAVLSGPSFAREVAEKHPTAVVVASKERGLAQKIQSFVSSMYFRAYSSDDVIGVELAGACKNIIAIATGISDGFGFGSNSMAGLVTRGLAEMTRLGIKRGARMETYAGLAGIGDLVLTCTGKLSRNRQVGHDLAKGKTLEEIVSGTKMIAEGISTTESIYRLAYKHKVDIPICEQVYQILSKNKDPKEAFQSLMSRELKDEYKP